MKNSGSLTTLDMDPFSLLGDALSDCQDGNGTNFVRRMAFTLLAQVLKENPDVVAMPDGKSILARAWAAGSDLGFYWWQIRGEEAWTPTAGTEQPLIKVIKNAEPGWDNKRFHVIGGGAITPVEARKFFQDGLKHAMPLRQVDADKWDTTKRLGADQKLQVNQQTFLVEYCLTLAGGGDLLAENKIKDLLAAGGALPAGALNNSSAQQNNAIAQTFARADSSHVNATVLDFGRFGERRAVVASPWWKLWKDRGDYSCAATVVKAMRREGNDPGAIKSIHRDSFIQDLTTITKNIRTQPAERSWHLVCEKLDQEQGWSMANEKGLGWHQALAIRPAMLPHVLSTATANLAQKSDKDIGIWDHLTSAVLQGTAPTTSLKRLAAKCPVTLSEDITRLLWLVWPKDSSKCESFMKASINQHPDLWLGTDSQQWNGSLWLMEQWASDEPHLGGRGTSNINTLFDPGIDRTLFSEGLQAVLQLIGHMAASNQAIGRHLHNALEFPITDAAEPTEKRLKQLNAKLSAVLGKRVIEPALKADIEAAALKLRITPTLECQGRRMRL